MVLRSIRNHIDAAHSKSQSKGESAVGVKGDKGGGKKKAKKERKEKKEKKERKEKKEEGQMNKDKESLPEK